MYKYKACGLTIQSELFFPKLENSAREPDVSIRIVHRDIIASIKQNNCLDCFIGDVAEAGTFCIIEGKEILVIPIPNVDLSFLRTIIMGPIICILLRQRGLLVLHASSFAVNGEAVAFMGDSGWGKSTLVESFYCKGYEILTDDVMIVENQPQYSMVLPGFAQIKLWPDAAAASGHKDNSLPTVHSQTRKLSHKINRGFATEPQQLKKIYLLSYGDSNKISALQPQEAFVHLIRHTRAVNLLTDPKFINSHFYQCSNLIKNVAVYRLQRKRSLTEIPQIIDLVEKDLEIFANVPSSK